MQERENAENADESADYLVEVFRKHIRVLEEDTTEQEREEAEQKLQVFYAEAGALLTSQGYLEVLQAMERDLELYYQVLLLTEAVEAGVISSNDLALHPEMGGGQKIDIRHKPSEVREEPKCQTYMERIPSLHLQALFSCMFFIDHVSALETYRDEKAAFQRLLPNHPSSEGTTDTSLN